MIAPLKSAHNPRNDFKVMSNTSAFPKPVKYKHLDVQISEPFFIRSSQEYILLKETMYLRFKLCSAQQEPKTPPLER